MNSEIFPTKICQDLPLNPHLITASITNPHKNHQIWDADQFKRDVIKILTKQSINLPQKRYSLGTSAEKPVSLIENSKSTTTQRSKSDDTKHQQNDQGPNQDVSTKNPLPPLYIMKYIKPLDDTKKDHILPLKRQVKITPPPLTKKLKLNDRSSAHKTLKKRGRPRKVKEGVLTNGIDLLSPEKSIQMKEKDSEGKKTAAGEGTSDSTTSENTSERIIELEISPNKESNPGHGPQIFQETNEKQPDLKEEIYPITKSFDEEEKSKSASNDKEEGSMFLFEEGYEMMIECHSEEDDFRNIYEVMRNKKEYNMIQGDHIEDAQNIKKIIDPIETKIRTKGGYYQAQIPRLRMKKYKKPVKLIWSPEMVSKENFARYKEKISKLLTVASERLNEERLIEILLQNGLHIENAVECVNRNLEVVRREVVLRNRNLV